MIDILIFLAGSMIGCLFTILSATFLVKREDRLNREKVNLIFTEVRDTINFGNSVFVNRINNSVQIDMNIKSIGDVSVYYFIDRRDINIFIGAECVYTSTLVDKNLISNISQSILYRFNKNINDVIDIQGLKIDKKTFTSMTGVQYLDDGGFEKTEYVIIEEKPKSLDDILDKINKVGYDNLTKSEKKFLENYGKD